MPASFGVQSFEIDSVLEMPADGYRAEASSATAFLQAADTDVVTLEAGLIDKATGLPQTVRHIEGNIDEYEVALMPEGLRTRVTGRDMAHEILDRPFKKLYLRQQPAQDPGIPYAVGTFRASEVARDVVVAAGLSLSWQCRDYTLLEDFDASGRSVDLLRRLVEPWSLTEVFRVDLFVQGKIVILRPRVNPFVADYTFTAKDARVSQLAIRKRRAPRYGKVTLEGRMVPKGAGGGTTVVQPSEIEEVKTSETRDAAGTVTGRTITIETYRMPDRILLKSVARTYLPEGGGMILTDEQLREREYESSIYGFLSAQNQPKLLEERLLARGIHPQDETKTFREIRKELKSFGYEEIGFQEMTTTKKFEVKKTLIGPPGKQKLEFGELAETERVVETLAEIEHLKVERVTTLYGFTKEAKIFVKQIDTQISAGLRPGGTRPPRAIISGGGNTTPMEPLKLELVISTHPKAQEFRYSNAHLELVDLNFIMDQLTAASGLWEHEVALTYVSMPWLRKGSVLHITTLFTEDGVTPIPLQPALILGQTLSFDESSESPSMTSRLTAVFWTS